MRCYTRAMDPVPPAPLQPAPQPEPVTAQQTPKPKLWLWVIGGILLLAAGTAGGMVLGKQIYSKPALTPSPTPLAIATPSPDPTANWKIYTSSAGKYSIKYPKEFTLNENITTSVDGVKNPAPGTIELLPLGVTISFKQINKDVSLTDYLRKNSWCADIVPEKGKGIILDGKSGMIFESTSCGSSGITEVDVLNDGTLYTTQSVSNTSVFNQILSTFKFTDQELKEGILEAAVVRSPTCAGPVTDQKSCESPYPNGTFTIIKLPNNEVMQTVNTDKDGTFTISLAPGVYNLQNTESGIGKNIRNSNFTITGGKTTIQKFDVDTGIR